MTLFRVFRFFAYSAFSVARFEQSGHSLAAADAHSHDAVFGFAPPHLVSNRSDQPRSGHSERVADRDRAAVDVELLRINAQAVAAVDDLNGEGFVQFPEGNVLDFQAVALQQLRDGEARADADLVRLASGDGVATKDHQRFDAELVRRVARDQ